MSNIHFIGGEKGGVGKSVLARLLAQYHIDRQRPFTAFDTDRSHGALLRFYADFSRPIALDEFESADQLMEAALCDHYDRAASYIAVRNYGRGRDFSAFDASPTCARALVLGAMVIDLPELHAGTMRKIDHQAISLWAATHNRESGLGLMDRQRAKVWLRRVYEQLDQLDLDLPTPTVTPTGTATTSEGLLEH